VDAHRNDAVDGQVLVVGTDGSAHSLAAFDWAVSEAMQHGGHVRVISAWHRDHHAPRDRSGEERAYRLAEATVDAVPHAAVDVVLEVREGLASDVLVEAAEDADLLVVGALGVQAGRRVVLGSVSARCALHAACPVVVVPEGWRSKSRASRPGRRLVSGAPR
jgi:nucleotide-binding universal stress UspA family protein